MRQEQILIAMDVDAFWNKLRSIVEDVLNERDSKRNQSCDQSTPHLLKAKEVCELFQISKPTIYDWMRKGQLRSVKIESRRFFLKNDIEELIVSSKSSVFK